jgi:hypothetical protein
MQKTTEEQHVNLYEVYLFLLIDLTSPATPEEEDDDEEDDEADAT